ncbi:hypothetical protein [Lentilactobacillus sp. SPB1-3]|uniref:Uncharacterized protein n=1 Tax=Lentilactobacillus terminaliae TaxID=3003483 RepID=A0ACD5DCU9_9LACO|nr:hypothetical protein [Lentilactobacillus sp. SPB1-3]MCZ0978121.1 hypothetical protein [Lentilactobacillus sp. SPB1-3]
MAKKEPDWITLVVKNILSMANKSIQVAYIGKITKLTPPTASIQPLAVISGKKQNIVPKARFITLPLEYTDDRGDKSQNAHLNYKDGDNVLVVVLDKDDMYFTNKGTFKVDSDRMHASDFSIVVGKVADADDFK